MKIQRRDGDRAAEKIHEHLPADGQRAFRPFGGAAEQQHAQPDGGRQEQADDQAKVAHALQPHGGRFGFGKSILHTIFPPTEITRNV